MTRPTRRVHARGERRRRADDFDELVAEGFLDQRAVVAGEARVVKRGPLFDGVREVVARFGVAHLADSVGDVEQIPALLVGQMCFRHVRESLRRRLGVSPGVDEHERRPAVFERIADERGSFLLVSACEFLLCAVVEVQCLPVEDTLPEVDGPPRRIDEGGIEPVGHLLRVADGRRQRDGLEVRVDPAEFGERDFERGTAMGVVDEVHFVGDDTGEVVDPLRAVSDERVDLLARGDDDVLRGEPIAVALVVPRGDADGDAVLFELLELLLFLAGERSKGDDVEGFATTGDARQHGEFRDERLPAGGRDAGDDALAVGDTCFDRFRLRRVEFLDTLRVEVFGNAVRQPRQVGDVHARSPCVRGASPVITIVWRVFPFKLSGGLRRKVSNGDRHRVFGERSVIHLRTHAREVAMKIEYDRNTCTGMYQCTAEWEEFVENREEGKADLLESEEVEDGIFVREVPDGAEFDAEMAARVCPVDAIKVYDDDGEQIV